jgi:hypothetical protein
MNRDACGADAGTALLERMGRLQAVTDPRLQKPLAFGFATFSERDVFYVVTAPIEGAALAELVGPEPGALLASEACAVMASAFEALGAAHAAGVIHGNVAPSNVYLSPGRHVTLCDFGLAPWARTSGGPVREVPAPELRDGGPGAVSADVFSLALSGASFVCGCAALRQWQKGDPGSEAAEVRAALARQPGVPGEVGAALERALEANPSARPAATAVAEWLRAFGGEIPEIAPADSAQLTPKDDGTSKSRIDAWLGEITDPRAPRMAAPLVVVAAAAAPDRIDTQPDVPMPVPPPAFLSEQTLDAPFPLPQTDAEVAAPAVRLSPGPVTVNLAAPQILLDQPDAFPLIARWTERTGDKGRGPVEVMRPKHVGQKQHSSARRPVALGGGFLLGVLVGLWMPSTPSPGPAPAPGSIHVALSPVETELEVDVSLDGRDLGKPPLTVHDVLPGPHVLVLRAEGTEPKVVSVMVTSGATSEVREAPELFAARLVVTSSVQGATVALDANKTHALPAEFDELAPGDDYELTFRFPNGQSTQRSVRLPAGELHFHVEAPLAAKKEEPEEHPSAQPAAGGRASGRPEAAQETEKASTPVAPHAAAPELDARDHVSAARRAIVAGRLEEAILEGQRALNKDATLADAEKYLAIALTRKGDACAGLGHYHRYLELRPRAVDADRVKSIIKDLEVGSGCKAAPRDSP